MSKKFYYIRYLESNCDIEIIKASSKEEAIEKIIDLPNNWKQKLVDWIKEENGDIDGCYHDIIGDTGLGDVMPDKYNHIFASDALLIEAGEEIDMMSILKAKFAETEDFKKELLSKAREEVDRKLYEELKKKFSTK